EGLWRSGRNRLAAGGDQCRDRCSEGLWRAAYRYAGVPTEALVNHPDWDAKDGCGIIGTRNHAMYDFAYQKPSSLADAVKALNADPDAKAWAGGMTLIPVLKQRLNKPS